MRIQLNSKEGFAPICVSPVPGLLFHCRPKGLRWKMIYLEDKSTVPANTSLNWNTHLSCCDMQDHKKKRFFFLCVCLRARITDSGGYQLNTQQFLFTPRTLIMQSWGGCLNASHRAFLPKCDPNARCWQRIIIVYKPCWNDALSVRLIFSWASLMYSLYEEHSQKKARVFGWGWCQQSIFGGQQFHVFVL